MADQKKTFAEKKAAWLEQGPPSHEESIKISNRAAGLNDDGTPKKTTAKSHAPAASTSDKK